MNENDLNNSRKEKKNRHNSWVPVEGGGGEV